MQFLQSGISHGRPIERQPPNLVFFDDKTAKVGLGGGRLYPSKLGGQVLPFNLAEGCWIPPINRPRLSTILVHQIRAFFKKLRE